MGRGGISGDVVTCNAAIGACAAQGQWLQACEVRERQEEGGGSDRRGVEDFCECDARTVST